MYRSEARLRYAQHKRNAERRGVEWEFTFDEWCEIWEPRWEQRGPQKHQLGMCRTHDKGPYRPDNVRLDTPRGNAGDRVLMRRRPWFKEWRGGNEDRGFYSYASKFARPEIALEMSRGERLAPHEKE